MTRAAIDRYSAKGQETLIAGSLTAVNDCYDWAKSPGHGAFDRHARQARLLAESGCDLILPETFSNVAEALCAFEASKRETGKPVWLAFSLNQQKGSRGIYISEKPQLGIYQNGELVPVVVEG